MARSKVKSRSHHDNARLDPNERHYQVSTSTPHSSRDIARTRFYRSRSLQGQRSNQGHNMMLQTYTPN